MQIQCPSCHTKLQLGQPKPGRYKPTCKKCGNPFLVSISGDDPPAVRVEKVVQADGGRAKESGSNQKTVAEGAASRTKAALDQTIEQTAPQSIRQPDQSASPRPTTSASVSRAVAPVGRAAPPDDDGLDATSYSAGKDDSDGFDEGITAAPSRLGGYRIIRMLGRGAMGAVYQAKQISLDRDVALKTIRGRLAENPSSLARFTREAYAAAQLSHHNVVQIYDFGEDDGQHFFSMEWVRGGSLGDLVREKGSIDPKLAATYILQAARGLQFAHRSGMIHRDVKPANLLLSEDGVVKVADLGLVKVPDQVETEWSGGDLSGDEPAVAGLQSGTQVTMQGTAVGTPAYMAPEQSADASSVDHRADIYSLGCSLFYLLAGRSPYSGSLVSEVIEQHARAPLPNLAEINSRVPEPLCRIVAHAMAKRPADRYASLAEMIGDLQSFLGVESMTGFSPSSDQADRWEKIAGSYSKSQTLTRLSGTLLITLAAVSILITMVSPFISLAAILVGPTFFLAACVVAIVMAATNGKSAVAYQVRRWYETLSWLEIAAGLFASVVVLLVTLATGLWIGALVGLLFGAVVGAAYHFGITATAAKSGSESMEQARRFLRDLRLEGADENGIRMFLARYAGKGWQTIYEALFGYDALVETRQRLSTDSSFQGPTDARSIRDRVCQWLRLKTQSNREAKNREKLAKLEQNSLISQGVRESDAREQAWQMASAIMETAQIAVEQTASDDKVIAEAKRQRIKAMLADARSGRYKRTRDRFAPVKFALSGFTRLLVGCLLLAAFAFAAKSSGLLSEEMVSSVRRGDLQSLPGDATTDALGGSTSVWSVGIAGCLLCLSAFVSGWRMTPFAFVATVVILFGASFGIPDIAVPGIGQAKAWMVAAAAGVIVYLPGILIGEEKR
ncbi:MAG: protein kinase [Planctomycetales bacterium]|nr:protein kinase [Planctomycetales bacterium]